MKTAILTQCFLTRPEQGRLLAVCYELLRRLNPDYDIILCDNASPLDPLDYVGKPLTVLRFSDSIGHFSPKFVHEHKVRRDGPGRANMTLLREARDLGYDRAVYTETDCLFSIPFEDGFRRMKKPSACLPRIKWGYLEWQAWWIADLKWLVDEHKFIEKYDWPNQTGIPEGERVYETILGPYLEVLPYQGGRGDGAWHIHGNEEQWQGGWVNASNLRKIWPECKFITHTSTETFAEFLRMNGFDDLVEKL
jgi:hypothetical protein